MDDEAQIRVPRDAKRVNVNDPYEVNYWCEQFGCTEAQLRAAVDRAGVIAKHVQYWLTNGDDR
jgi:hypothetical protein